MDLDDHVAYPPFAAPGFLDALYLCRVQAEQQRNLADGHAVTFKLGQQAGNALALDRGGTCRGVAFRIPARDVRSELLVIWRREMFGTAYLARWVEVKTPCASVPAITFVVNRDHPRYAGKLSDAETATRIASASGSLGTCAAYLQNTLDHLAVLGIRDAALERIVAEAAKT